MSSHKAVIQEWLDLSQKDYDLACLALKTDEVHYAETVVFHLQQSIEKLLKAVLVKHREPFSKTHALDELATKIAPFVGDWQPDFDSLDNLTELGIGARYPGYRISLEELHWALDVCNSVRAKLLPLFQA